MFGHETGRENAQSETVIGSSVKVEGQFVGKGNIVVDGRVVGSMKTDQDIVVSQGAAVKADLEARNLTLAGEVRGNIKVHDRFELKESGKLFGDVEAKVVSVSPGAVLNGKCTMVTEQGMQTEPGDIRNDRQAKNGKARPA